MKRLTIQNGDVRDADDCQGCDNIVVPDWNYCPHCGRELDR